PDPPIYTHTCRELGLEPGRCVFVDDLLANVEGAQAVGMKGIHHTSPGETLGLLQTFFGLDLA
ncbi:MAG TPA: HAD-IA family hydrolase, partial [Actinomycetota bacterium]|nr:HAD-IA family hydrolase [Actinomycetota bacterium]